MIASGERQARCFSCRRGIAPMLWVLLSLSVIELVIVHLLIALLWSRAVAVGLTIVSLLGIGWIVAAIRSLRTRPVMVAPDRLILRAGRLAAIEISPGDVSGIRNDFTGAEVKARETLNLALIAFPNLLLDLRRPVRWRRRTIMRVALKLDDPEAFLAALSSVRAAG